MAPDWLCRMSISGRPTNTGPAEVLARVRSEVAELAELLWAAQADGEVVEVWRRSRG